MARDYCARLGIGFVEPPPYSQSTVERGVAVAPEHFCFPMKVLLGSAMESLEAGADTLVTVAGYGACRFNYFAELQKRILEREGYEFRLIAFDAPRDSVPDFYRNLRAVTGPTRAGITEVFKQLGLVLRKGNALDAIDKRAAALRALEVERGSVDRVAAGCREMLEGAFSSAELDETGLEIARRFDALPMEEERPHLRVGVTGEIMVSIEPYFSHDIEHWLAGRGAVVERSIYMSDIMTPWGKNPVRGWTDEEVERHAAPYLTHEVGGHGQINVAAAVDYARRGFDAVIHIFPFTCLPEVIARTVFVRVSRDMDIPILSMSVDEQTGRAGTLTRLEALVDLAWARRQRARGRAVAVPGAT